MLQLELNVEDAKTVLHALNAVGNDNAEEIAATTDVQKNTLVDIAAELEDLIETENRDGD